MIKQYLIKYRLGRYNTSETTYPFDIIVGDTAKETLNNMISTIQDWECSKSDIIIVTVNLLN